MHNEAGNLPRLALSLLTQSSPPSRWIMVDTGSSDETLEIARRLCLRRPSLMLERIAGAGRPTRGGQVVDALHHALGMLPSDVEVVVKVDADVSFDQEHFETLLAHFQDDARLGMASGIRYEFERGRWRAQGAPATTVEAQVRAYRRACLASILPFERRMGFDVIDESTAVARGWRTGHFEELAFRHHRRMGARDGSRRAAWCAQGQIAHHVGYRWSYLLARTCFRATRDPSALFMCLSFLYAKLSRRPQSANGAAIAVRRRQQRLRELPRRIAESLSPRVLAPTPTSRSQARSQRS